MFERYLTDALTTYFGAFVENLDVDKVRLSAWRGELVLEDLRLRKNALEAVLPQGCPLEIAYGRVGNLELRIPWGTTKECVLILSDLHILLTPKSQRCDPDNEEDLSVEEKRARKEHKVQRLLDAQLFERVAKSEQPSSTTESSRWQWARERVAKLLSNLHVTIRNIHVRYEDPGSSLGFVWTKREQYYGNSFAIGVTLRQFSVQTTYVANEDKDPAYPIRHKLAAAYQLAVYWDRGCHLMASNVYSLSMEQQEYYASAFDVLNGNVSKDFVHGHFYDTEHNYVLAPVSPSMKLSLVSETVSDDETDIKDAPPSSSIEMLFPACQLTIAANTLEDTAYLRKSFSVWNRTRKSVISETCLRRLTTLRPLISPKEDPQQWWKYALEATLVLEESSVEKKRKRGWLGLVEAIKGRREYVRLYESFLCADKEESNEAHWALLRMEDVLLLDEIVAFRMSVYSMITKPTINHTEAPSHRTWGTWIKGSQNNPSTYTPEESKNVVPMDAIGIQQLTVDHRYRMFLEMAQMLEQEKANQKLELSLHSSGLLSALDLDQEANIVVWKTSMAFKQLSLHINERIDQQRPRPVVRLSCAAIQRQTLYHDGSWEVESAVASLEVVDLTDSFSGRIFPVLVGRKYDSETPDETVDDKSDDTVSIEGTTHPLSASVFVRRTIDRDIVGNGLDRTPMTGTTTYSVIRLLPLEIVYSTNPVAALTRALSTVKTTELSDDYHRMASVVSQWQKRQKKRLLKALAHTRKKIIVDVDVAAPVLVIPEDVNRDNSPLLMIDLGRMKFSNTNECVEEFGDYDDKWKLALSEIQVQCSSTGSYRMKRSERSTALCDQAQRVRIPGAQKLVEPFSLQFIISTRIADEVVGASKLTIVNVYATLPRLVFNLTASAVRLVERLKLQWTQRTVATRVASFSVGTMSDQRNRPCAIDGSFKSNQSFDRNFSVASNRPDETGGINRMINFRFSAPLIGFRLVNDVDGRGVTTDVSRSTVASGSGDRVQSCPLVDLAFRDIRGIFSQTVSSGAKSTSVFDAKLRSVDAIDLYQNAGDDFAFLLSSLPPLSFSGKLPTFSTHSVQREEDAIPSPQDNNDLVSLRYVSCSSTEMRDTHTKSREMQLKDTLSIKFHELYVEWNPETIAAIHKAMMLPTAIGDGDTNKPEGDHAFRQSVTDTPPNGAPRDDSEEESEDEFYDAFETEVDSDSSFMSSAQGGDESDVHFISEISSCASSFSDATELLPQAPLGFCSPAISASPFSYNSRDLSQHGRLNHLISSTPSPADESALKRATDIDGISKTTRSFEVTFNLSKLRVNFNKESRHRRLMTAEMDGTDVHYLRKPSGVSISQAKIGNLTFSDPSSATNSTLYGEVLGLKPRPFGQSSEIASSLLEMDLCINPRSRRVISADQRFHVEVPSSGVTIDCYDGKAVGSDISVLLRLSPMRFVYLQQLWFEIVDYFFEAIIGYEVWGSERPPSGADALRSELGDGQQDGPPTFRSGVLRRNLPGIRADDFSFTRFDVVMEDPMLLIPVAYRSPHFLRLEFSSLTASNYYLAQIEAVDNCSGVGTDLPTRERVQWYNNCVMELRGLKMTSWEGAEISRSPFNSSTHSTGRSETEARIKLKWPTGKRAFTIIPKWKVECNIDKLGIVLRREDYALLQHVIWHNIGEPSRHLEEWDALQNLSPADLKRYKSEIMVHFGYDKKDTAPTTYSILVKVPSLKFFLLGPRVTSEEVIMEANCTSLEWRMRKLLDRVSWQRVACDIALVKPGVGEKGDGTKVDLLLPADYSTENHITSGSTNVDHSAETSRVLSYTSTTQPSGDNVKTLEIANPCIFSVYPIWMDVKQFFVALPAPFLIPFDEVGLLMQIGDRWYKIGGSGSSHLQSASTKPAIMKSEKSHESDTKTPPVHPSYQFRLLLSSARVILPSTATSGKETCAVLHMDHFDFLHRNDADSCMVTKNFFVHDLELYTSTRTVLSQHGFVGDNSLIHPWCIAGVYERCNGQSAGSCGQHIMRVSTVVLRARAAYSDMSVAIDVGLQLLSDVHHESYTNVSAEQSRLTSRLDRGRSTDEEETHSGINPEKRKQGNIKLCDIPLKSSLSVELDGFELLVVDDSMRHFANAQQLIKLSLSRISFYQVVTQNHDRARKHQLEQLPQGSISPTKEFCMTKQTKLRLHRFDLFDCLQPPRSPFRLVATSRPTQSERDIPTQSEADASSPETSLPRMSWLDFRTVDHSQWGYVVSPSLLGTLQNHSLLEFDNDELRSASDDCTQVDGFESQVLDLVELHRHLICGVSDEYRVKLRCLTMQWNPSTVIALQRFLGRLLKEAKTKSEKQWAEASASAHAGFVNASLIGGNAVPTRLRFQIERLTACLNKEHQNRRLVQVTLSDSHAYFEHDARSGMKAIEGFVEDLNVWDTDTYTEQGLDAIIDENRRILGVISSEAASPLGTEGATSTDGKFLQFRYKTYADAEPSSGHDLLPSWIKSRLEDCGDSKHAIDDYLWVSVAALRFNFIRERAEEILDYLSNGLPGKGMGATSRAAKGFINKRIQTSSYLELNIEAPQMYIPQHEKANRGVLVRLGDFNVKSWFEEVSEPKQLKEASAYAEPQTVWYRVLSLSVTGLWWSAHEQLSFVDGESAEVVPVNLNLNLRKPTGRGKTIAMRGNLSCIDLTLTYTVYVLLKAVIRDNVSREIDTTRWDNVEKAYSMEEEEEVQSWQNGVLQGDRPAYSSNARFIQYGRKRQRKGSAAIDGTRSGYPMGEEQPAVSDAYQITPPSDVMTLDCVFELDGLRLKFHRNDPLDGLGSSSHGSDVDSAFNYDMMVLRADAIEISVNTTSAGDKSLQLSLRRLGLFDLGDIGRLARERYYHSLTQLNAPNNEAEGRFIRDPCAFSVLAEGYSPSEAHVNTVDTQNVPHADPQLIITIDSCSASSVGSVGGSMPDEEGGDDKIVIVRVVINYLSVNPLIRPLREIISFLTCSWSVPHLEEESTSFTSGILREPSQNAGGLVDYIEQDAAHTSSRRGFQLKLVAHYPQIFFLADESDPNSRALVLRGLAVLNASMVKQEIVVGPDYDDDHVKALEEFCGFSDKKVVTDVNAHLHSMETYINPNVDGALGLNRHHADIFERRLVSAGDSGIDRRSSDNRLLGVALIEPVTAGVEFCQIKRDRFPTLDSYSVNMEPVSTMVSFEDLTLIEAILGRWSSRTTKSSSEERSTSNINEQRGTPTFSDRDEMDGIDVQTICHDVTFEANRLGLILKKRSTGAVVVDSVQDIEKPNSVQPGDTLLAINGEGIGVTSLQDVVERLASTPRPVRVTFSRKVATLYSPQAPSSSYGILGAPSQSHDQSVGDSSIELLRRLADNKHVARAYTVMFRRGVPNGLSIDLSPCGNLPVVIDVTPSLFLDAVSVIDGESGSLEVNERRYIRIPRTGAVVTDINGKPTSEIGYLEAKDVMRGLSEPKPGEDETKNTVSGKETSFSVSFIELDSSEWGAIKTADIRVAGIALTFIDDFKGRDMPLLRGWLDAVDIHLERGLGIDARAIIAGPPNVLDLLKDGVDSADAITTIRILLQTEIDYYHPRIAVWEPLLEPSHLCFLVEWQNTSAVRPGQLAVEASDRFLGGSEAEGQTPSLAVDSPRIVSLNLTDAAVDTLARAIKEWREWRQGSLLKQQLDEGTLGYVPTRPEEESLSDLDDKESVAPLTPMALSEGKHKTSRVKPPGKLDASSSLRAAKVAAAQKAAKAALVFAQKRGAGKQNKSESSKPFVFKNRTGMSLTFTQQSPTQYEGGKKGEVIPSSLATLTEEQGKHDRPSGMTSTYLADGSDARFHIDVVSQDQPANEEDQIGAKRVRTYEGQYPSLCVVFETLPGVALSPLKNLPVFKVGSTIRRLDVQKLHSGSSEVCLDPEGETSMNATVEFSVPVVWTVEIEDNRRILTLSSAVRVLSAGINVPTDVGVNIADSPNNSGRTAEGITRVGTAESGSSFYLPLWLALRREEVAVFIKPNGMEYNWSKKSILSFAAVHDVDAESTSDFTFDDDRYAESNLKAAPKSATNWTWKETFETSCSVPCEPCSDRKAGSDLQTLWLSCVSMTSRNEFNDPTDLISVAIDAGLTLRNMLPVNLLWEVAAYQDSKMFPLDGSSSRKKLSYPTNSLTSDDCQLFSGAGVDVLAFNPTLIDPRARFRCHPGQEWSSWANLALLPIEKYPGGVGRSLLRSAGGDEILEAPSRPESKGRATLTTRQLNVQIRDEFGIPLTIGVRIVPKLARVRENDKPLCYGFDIIVFAELWLRNLTSLPLAFGCPSTQINKNYNREFIGTSEPGSDEFGVINAEAALIEIASVLEFGEKGKGLNLGDEGGSVINQSDTYLLPYQTANLIFEEVFEYVEIENSTIKRRWWGSERHDSWRQNPLDCRAPGNGWHWIDEEWKIDCSGQAIGSTDGWESCRSLIAGKGSFFSSRRTFNPSHPFRRRRWFRRRQTNHHAVMNIDQLAPGQLYESIGAFHQPVDDAFSRAQELAQEIQKKKERSHETRSSKNPGNIQAYAEKGVVKVSIRCADGQWSVPCILPQTGEIHGVIKVPASRWPTLTKVSRLHATELPQAFGARESIEGSFFKGEFASGSLSPELYELCYKVSVLGGDWDDFTRLFLLTPRFMLRNDSQVLAIEVKQSGAPDESAVVVNPGDSIPFYWADFRLPQLACVRPVVDNKEEGSRKYKWSGGFDVCTLGMTAIRVRQRRVSSPPPTSEITENSPSLKSIRALVEIRPGTGGTGINISFKEEDPRGNGSLFRIENLSPFPIWLAQDGVLANPFSVLEARRARLNQELHGEQAASGVVGSIDPPHPVLRLSNDYAVTDGELIGPMNRTAYALDVPFRQGKYAGRKAASMSELMRVRVGLAPLSSRDGIESTKVLSFSTVGESIKLSPAKLSSITGFDMCRHLVDLRVLGIVTTDGPTRVLRFCMMRKNDSVSVFDYPFIEMISPGAMNFSQAVYGNSAFSDVGTVTRGGDEYLQQITLNAAITALELDVPGEDVATRLAFFGTSDDFQNENASQGDVCTNTSCPVQYDTVYSFRASFYGFSCSLIDAVPSEIALVTLKDVNAFAKWNKRRTADASALVSVGWLQVDNHIPSAPFPVAVCPDEAKSVHAKTVDETQRKDESEHDKKASPLLLVGLTFAPKHKSGILCLRSVTIAPQDLDVSVDLAFIVRLQQFFVGLHQHLLLARDKENVNDKSGASLSNAEQKRRIPFPDIASIVQSLEGANAVGVGSQKLYFEGLTILPCNVNLSVAPARALTSTQALLEGSEAAALHAAIRKGDVLVGSGMLGVKTGHTNKTAVAVVRGVFKSIIVDALLRCEAASLNFSGVYLRNHISTGPQLKIYLAAHYLESLRSNIPTLLGSMAAFGNPLGLIRGLGDGMSDFVTEPVKGLRKSMEELDPSFVVGGVARGTESLARHAVGGFAGSASLITETFSKNMAVLTLDRRYAQRRDRRNTLRSPDRDFAVTFFEGVESGVVKLVRGVFDGVTGVVKAPLRGAERQGMEGFAKGVGKGLLGLLVKPMIGLSDAATDVMIGVQGSVEGASSLLRGSRHAQVRPRRPMYGRDRVLRPYSVADAAAATLMLRTKLAGENYLSHCDMDDRVALLSVKRALLLGADGKELLLVKFRHIEEVKVRPMPRNDDVEEWAVIIVLRTPRMNGSEVEVIKCKDRDVALELCSQLNRGVSLMNET